MFFLIFLSTLIVGLVTFTFFILKSRRKFFQLRDQIGIGGPPPHFFLGNLKQIIENKKRLGYDDSYRWHEQLHEEYGETMGVYLGNQLNLNFTNEEDIKEIFIKNFANFSHRSMPPIFEKASLVTSLLQVSYENGWKNIRSSIAPIFATGKMRAMHETIETKIQTFLDILEDRRKAAVDFDIYGDFQALTLDVIGKCAFAIDSDCQKNREEVFYVQARNFINNTDIRHSAIITASFLLPELNFIWNQIYRFTNLALSEIPLIDGLSNVYERRKAGEGAESVDLLKLLINREDDKEKQQMTKQEVIENCFAFLLAGYETTSTVLTYSSYLLGKHLDVQNKLYEEICETKNAENGLNFNSIMNMKYLDAVYKESMRVYPPVIHFVNRVCLNDITIRGKFIPKGTVVSVLPYNVHMNEKNWEDPKSFKPERFLNWNEKSSLKWIPFGVGPRYCVGMRFAEMEYKTTMVRLLEKFQLEIPENAPELIPDCNGVIMRPKDAVNIKLSKRS